MSSLAAQWERRYKSGRDSGAGSRGEKAQFKADYVSALIEREKIQSVFDYGVGDGYVMSLMRLPRKYMGVDVSRTAIQHCKDLAPKRKFMVLNQLGWPLSKAELGLSLDVIFHLVREGWFASYMRRLFWVSTRFVCIFALESDAGRTAPHVMYRRWTPWVAEKFPKWELIEKPVEGEFGFFLFRLCR